MVFMWAPAVIVSFLYGTIRSEIKVFWSVV